MKVKDFIRFLTDFNMDAELVIQNGNTFDDYEEMKLSWGGPNSADGDGKKDAEFIYIDNKIDRKYPAETCKTIKNKIDPYVANNFIIDYKKEYKEALERAKDVYTYYCDDTEQLRKIEHIFPELKVL